MCVIAFSVFYYFDQRVAGGPSIAERQVEHAEAAVVQSPSNVGLRVALAEAYQMDNRLDDSLKQYGEVLRVEPDHRAALLGQGRLLYAKGDVDRAVTPLDKIAKTALKGEFAGADVQLQEALYYLGAIDLQKGRTEDAVAHLKRSLSINPADSDAHYQLGSALLKAGKPKDAVPEFRTAVLFVPTDWCEPYDAMAAAYTALKDEAGQRYAQAMAQFCQGDAAGATKALTGLAEEPQGVDAMVGLGLIAEKSADREKASRVVPEGPGRGLEEHHGCFRPCPARGHLTPRNQHVAGSRAELGRGELTCPPSTRSPWSPDSARMPIPMRSPPG